MPYHELQSCIETINRLRDPKNGCPWDLEQTHESLLKYLIEESYEYIEAVKKANSSEMEDELGDILLQVILHAKIASEENHFDLESVARNLKNKIIRRHPHVFSSKDRELSKDEVIKEWEKIKANEKQTKDYILKEKLRFGPSLDASHRIGEKSRTIHFDWNNAEDVWAKVEEELKELRVEIDVNNKEKIFEEMGDLLFSLAQYARHLGFNAEDCLQAANKKFLDRFHKVEDHFRARSLDISKATQEELEKTWSEIKKDA